MTTMAMPMPMRRGGDNEYDYGGSGKTGGSVARGKIVKKMASGGGVKKMAAGSLVTAPPKPSPDDEQNRFVPNARKKLLDAQRRQALLGMPEGLKHGGKVTKPWEGSKADMAQDRKLADKQNLSMDKFEKSAMDRKMDAKGLNHGGKVKKMADGGFLKYIFQPPIMTLNDLISKGDDGVGSEGEKKAGAAAQMRHGGKVKKMAGGGSSGEMQAFMKGRRDARGSMAPRAAVMPKASMAPMAPKARMMSKAPMAPMASMLGMKSGGAARGNSRGNGCAVKGHARGRMV
jgi:hypothetical protein